MLLWSGDVCFIDECGVLCVLDCCSIICEVEVEIFEDFIEEVIKGVLFKVLLDVWL